MWGFGCNTVKSTTTIQFVWRHCKTYKDDHHNMTGTSWIKSCSRTLNDHYNLYDKYKSDPKAKTKRSSEVQLASMESNTEIEIYRRWLNIRIMCRNLFLRRALWGTVTCKFHPWGPTIWAFIGESAFLVLHSLPFVFFPLAFSHIYFYIL